MITWGCVMGCYIWYGVSEAVWYHLTYNQSQFAMKNALSSGGVQTANDLAGRSPPTEPQLTCW